MDEEKFWKTTPRKLSALLKVHAKVNSAPEKGDDDFAYIDELDFM